MWSKIDHIQLDSFSPGHHDGSETGRPKDDLRATQEMNRVACLPGQRTLHTAYIASSRSTGILEADHDSIRLAVLYMLLPDLAVVVSTLIRTATLDIVHATDFVPEQRQPPI